MVGLTTSDQKIEITELAINKDWD